ncbi:TetR family transcriptional regulator C-terminal domain-containing protein [Roseibium sp.]|uniref:TetR family transcriptional regulator C-terminal domain-containing protein n=1 Tax=Roseibium sp. TaxID=1936156 RepID=UPI003A9737D4
MGRAGTNEKAGLSRIQEKNRGRIIHAALGQFSRHGYAGTTIDKIAVSAGMSKSNLLYYFASKTALYEAALAHILNAWLDPLRGLNVDADPAKELTRYILQKMKMSAELPAESRLFANEILQGAPRIRPVLENDLKRLVDEKTEVIRQWIDQGRIAPIEPVHLIFSIWAITQHYADFEPQIVALTGKTVRDPEFRKSAEATVLQLVLSGLGLSVPEKMVSSDG